MRPVGFFAVQRARLGQRLVIGVPLILLLVLIFYPLAAIILQSVFAHLFTAPISPAPDLSAIGRVFTNRQSYTALFYSLTLGAITAIAAGLIGTLLAVLMQRTDVPLRRVFEIGVWMVFFTPSFMLSEAWSLVFTYNGFLSTYLHFSRGVIETFFSPVGVIFLLSIKAFPLVYLSVSAALSSLGSEYEDAARLAGARPRQAWLAVNIPLLLPAILAAALLAFAEAIADFGVAATISQNASVPLVTYQIYLALNTSPVDFSLAASLSLLLFAATGVALIVQARLLRSRSYQIISGRSRPARRMLLGKWKIPAFSFFVLVFALALLIPVGIGIAIAFLSAYERGFDAANWTLNNFQTVLSDPDDLAALVRSSLLAIGTASFTVLIGLPIAFIIRRTQLPGRWLLSFVTLATVAVPSIILASGYIFAWNAKYLERIGIGGVHGLQIYGTIGLLLAAYTATSLPLVTRLTIGGLDQVGQTLLESART